MSTIVHYGYTDASGEYYITIGAACDGCAKCAEACPGAVLEMIVDDYDEPAAAVKPVHRRELKYLCAPCKPAQGTDALKCQQACPQQAIRHSW